MWKDTGVFLGVCTLFVAAFSSSAEMGVHWWPCGEAAWEPLCKHEVVVFGGCLWLIDGEIEYYGICMEEDDAAAWPCWWGQRTRDVWRSDDGINWSYLVDLPNNVSPSIRGTFSAMVSEATIWIIGNLNNSQVASSTDGITWTEVADWAPQGQSLPFRGSLWSLRSSSTDLLVISNSIDGATWTSVETTPSEVTSDYLQGAVEFDGRIVALDYYNGAGNWASEDGVTWSPLPAGGFGYEELRIRRAVVASGRIWIFGSPSQILCSDDAINWHVVTNGYPFGGRWDFPAVSWNDRIWVFGGKRNRPSETETALLNDIWYTEETRAEVHRADYEADGELSLSELLRVVQLYQAGKYQCDGRTEDSYAPGEGYETCVPHSSDYHPQDWTIDLSELLRLVQLYNWGGYHYCPDAGTEDGFCPGGAGAAM